jgi:hypothetical protein
LFSRYFFSPLVTILMDLPEPLCLFVPLDIIVLLYLDVYIPT